MADPKLAHPANVPGEFFVDTNCIDCPTCRQIAPTVFGDAVDQPVVARQPTSGEETRQALMALVSCPAASIGTRSPMDVGPALAVLPQLLAEDVYYCGYASPDAFGAHSYFIHCAEGNILVDSPRFTKPLVRRLEQLGGIRFMFLTHHDDVAEHEKFQKHFGCERILHEADTRGSLKSVERKLTGDGPWAIAAAVKIIGVSGHTRGSMALLYRNNFLFTGDHLSWRRDVEGLFTSRQYCQYSWDEQRHSVEKLLGEKFTWILPGHGYRYQAPLATMRAEICKAVRRMGGDEVSSRVEVT
ncbi:MAG TPA: MBL fold metallo-hydrolase [Terriglobales bacterium]|jgi:glyoxylase-like metal-dependent hydrolase (beta-lactamase superfamily II)|nr:MBL fold metallo-hydrolase [Terriglobales bacterium]